MLSRRQLLALSAAAPWLRLPGLATLTGRRVEPLAVAPVAHPFPLRQVRLGAGPWRDQLELNKRFLLGLDPDRLLVSFRRTAGLPTTATPYGGWEAPDNELRGHFVGHYLSACALLASRTGEEVFARRGSAVVAGLAACQRAHGDGYLSAFPREFFERLRTTRRVWAPFYTLHKIMAGLLDMHALAADAPALAVVTGMADWTARYMAALDEAAQQKMLNVEHGGMVATLYDLAAVTGRPAWRDLGDQFRHRRIIDPLVAGRDELSGVHGNTTIPKVLGECCRYDASADADARRAAEYFWETVALHRSYATGGTTTGEGWVGGRDQLAATLNQETQETCVSYNMLKLSRHLFTWSGDARYADFYERAWWNGIMGTQHPADGEKLYYTPLATGYWKLFGTPEKGFWCCHGTGVENFAKAGDSVFFHDATGLWVNLYLPAELRWAERGLTVRQETRFPESDRVTLSLHAAKPVKLALRLRIPHWAGEGIAITVNGRAHDGPHVPGSYTTIERTWSAGDRVELRLPLTLRAEPMPDDPTLVALLYGPLVLAGKMGTAGITAANRRAGPTAPYTVPEFRDPDLPPAPVLRGTIADLTSWLEPVPGTPLAFRTRGQEVDYTLVPLARLFDERYAVYWTLRSA